MSARRLSKQGFTLVEILIVVVILGILAAIVIPQFTSASQTAKASSLQSQLQTIRSQIELYQIQHNGDYPTLASLQTGAPDEWTQLTTWTTQAGVVVLEAALDGDDEYGPYLQQAPSNPFLTGNGSVSVVAWGAGASGDGWEYNENTGAIKAVIPDTIDATEASNLGLDAVNDVVLTAA
jgi:general secretion pathway protein G